MPITRQAVNVYRREIRITDGVATDGEYTFRIYKALDYINGESPSLKKRITSEVLMRRITNNQPVLKIPEDLMRYPLILTIQETDGEEYKVDMTLGTMYQIRYCYTEREIGIKRKSRETVCVLEIYMPDIEDVFDERLLYVPVAMGDGNIYRIHLPELRGGRNVFYCETIPKRPLIVDEKYRRIFGIPIRV